MIINLRRKDAEGCLNVTMVSYDGAEVCELKEIYTLSCLPTIIDKNDCVLLETTVYWSCIMSIGNKKIMSGKKTI